VASELRVREGDKKWYVESVAEGRTNFSIASVLFSSHELAIGRSIKGAPS
jgi:hypothetical protein